MCRSSPKLYKVTCIHDDTGSSVSLIHYLGSSLAKANLIPAKDRTKLNPQIPASWTRNARDQVTLVHLSNQVLGESISPQILIWKWILHISNASIKSSATRNPLLDISKRLSLWSNDPSENILFILHLSCHLCWVVLLPVFILIHLAASQISNTHAY